MGNTKNVTVSIRIKPTLTNSCLNVLKDVPVIILPDRQQTYMFDHVFDENVTQTYVFDNTVKPLLEHLRNGYNCTVFTYGQTGTGKSYTMGTFSQLNHKDEGLIPRTLDSFFTEENNFEKSISFIEIYNEKVYDLLSDNKSPLIVKGFTVCNFSKHVVCNLQEAICLLNIGNTNRHTGETKQNSKSSRSHAIFTIHCNSLDGCDSKLNLVDLAGCESVKKTGTQGNSFFEGININKGLLSIGQVMSALAMDAAYIPYRQSVLTTILQDSLNKRNYVSLISCVSPLPEDINETVQSLEFAYRVKKIKSKPIASERILQNSCTNSYTPFKRPYMMTPNVAVSNKKSRVCSSFSKVPSQCKNNTIISPLSTSSTSSIIFPTDTSSFSPVIKKYISAMESSIVEKLGSVIEKSLKLRRSSRKSVKFNDKENTPNSPKFSWNQIQSEVSKLVKSELQQFSAQPPIRATSSPIVDETAKLKRVLSYDSPDFKSVTIDDKENSFTVFKIPPLPKTDTNTKNNFCNPRRSVRLSLKNCSISTDNDECSMSEFKKPPLPNKETNTKNCYNPRRSVRLSLKNCSISTDFEVDSPCENSNIKQTKNKMSKPKNKPKGKASSSSPMSAHNKHVVNILNSGTLKQLEGLHSVGIKTAQQILLYRNLKGNFSKIEDLREMPGWSERKVNNFMAQNFLV